MDESNKENIYPLSIHLSNDDDVFVPEPVVFLSLKNAASAAFHACGY